MNKKILYGLILLLTLSLSLGVVSASEIGNETLKVSLEATSEVDTILPKNDDVLSANMKASNENDDVLSVNEGTFEELQNTINQGSGTIYLQKDYAYNQGFSTDGISISKSITIDGQGHTIDGKGVSRIFRITGQGITLKNINLVNGFHNNYGGAALVASHGATIDNCTFDNNVANGFYGGALSWSGRQGTLTNSIFTSNHVVGMGGAIFWQGVNGNLKNLKLINNTASRGAGGLYISDQDFTNQGNIKAYNITFINNTAHVGDGAIIVAKNSAISHSTFY